MNGLGYRAIMTDHQPHAHDAEIPGGEFAPAEPDEQAERAFAAALVDAAALLSRAPDLEALFDGILETLARIVPYDTASIMRREGGRLVVARARGFAKYGLEEWVKTVSFPLDSSKFLQLAERDEPLVITDTLNDPDWIALPESHWIQSHLSVPIIRGCDTLGLLSLDSETRGLFRPEDGARLMPFASLVGAALLNARLLDRAERRAREFQALYQTTRDLSVTLEAEELLTMIVDHAVALLDAPLGSVIAYNPGTGMLDEVVTRGDGARLNQSARMGEGLMGQVAQTRQPLVVNDYANWAARTVVGGQLGVQAAVAVPILYRNTLFGVLGVAHREPGKRIEQSQATLLTLFAGQAGAALETARLLRESRQRAEQLAMLYDIGLTLNRSLDPRAQLVFMFHIARRAIHAARMAFFEYDASEEVLRFQAGIGASEQVQARVRAMRFALEPPTTLVGWVARERLPARIPDVRVDERWVSEEGGILSALAVPVEHDQTLCGVLLAGSENRDAFSAQDERLLVLCGNQVAAAIELARLFGAQERRHAEMQTLREASVKFTATRERAQLVPLILECALGLVAADAALLDWRDGVRLSPAGMLAADPDAVLPEHRASWSEIALSAARRGAVVLAGAPSAGELSDVWWQSALPPGSAEAVLALPLCRGEQVLAVLTMVFVRPHRFDRDEVRALRLLADQATVALENARHYAESQAQLRDAQLLHRAGEALNRNLSVWDTAQQLASFFMEALRVDACTISQLDRARDEIQIVHDHEPIAELRLAPGATERLSNVSHLERALAERRTMMYRRDATDLAPDSAAYMDKYRWLALLVLPLFEGIEIIGLVELVDRQQARDFAPDEVRLAESLAHQAASALRNARLYQETRQRAQELAQLNQAAQRRVPLHEEILP